MELKAIYSKADGRGAKYSTLAQLEVHWKESAPAYDVKVRDAPCHEAVTGKRLMLDDASLDQLVGEHCFVSMQLLLLQAVV